MQQLAARMPVHEKLSTWPPTYAGTVTKIEYNVSRMMTVICASQDRATVDRTLNIFGVLVLKAEA